MLVGDENLCDCTGSRQSVNASADTQCRTHRRLLGYKASGYCSACLWLCMCMAWLPVHLSCGPLIKSKALPAALHAVLVRWERHRLRAAHSAMLSTLAAAGVKHLLCWCTCRQLQAGSCCL